MNDEKKQKLVKAAEMLGLASDIIKSVRDEEQARCQKLSSEDKDSDTGFFIQMDVDDLSDILEELDEVQTSMVDMADRINKEEDTTGRTTDDKAELIGALGLDKDKITKRLDYVKRFCNRIGIEMNYEMCYKK